MYNNHRIRIGIIAASLLVLFGLIFLLNIKPQQRESITGKRDLQALAQAMRKIRKPVKSAIGSPEDPQARFMFEYRRIRNPYTGRIPVNIRERELAFSATLPVAEAITFNRHGRNARGMVANWKHRGPYNVGGRTRALAIDVENESIIVAGGVSGGMWRSTNNGLSWVKTTDPALLQSATTVTQDKRPGKTRIWYYGTGELEGNSASAPGALYRGNGIHKSTDNGASWFVLPSTATNNITTFNSVFQWNWRVAANPANPNQDEVLAATIGGIQRSTDGGTTWNNVLGTIAGGEATNNYPRYTDIAISATGVMYATLSQFSADGGTSLVKGIFRSTDGVNWTDITPVNFPTLYGRIVLDISPSNENIVYFLAHTPLAGKFEASLFRYTYLSGSGAGAGGSWENRSANIPAFGGTVGNLNLQGGYNMMVKVKPDNPNVVFIGGTNLYRSTDGFTSMATTRWIGGYSVENDVSIYPDHHPDQHNLVFYPSSTIRAVSAHDGGLSRTENIMNTQAGDEGPVDWVSLNNGYLTTQFTSVAIDMNSTDDFLLGGMQDNGTWGVESENSTERWFEIFFGDGAFGSVVGDNSIIVSAQNAYIFRIVYKAGEDPSFARIDPKGGGGYLFVNPYVLDPNNQKTMYLPAGDTLWRNNNIEAIPVGRSDEFYEQSDLGWDVLATLPTSRFISAVSISKSPANIIYFGTADGKVYKITNAATGTNREEVDVTGSNFPAGNFGAYVSCIDVDPTNANNVIVSFSNYGVISLFATTNGGTTWTPVAGNLEQNPNGTGDGPSIRWINILRPPRGQAKYFVGTSTGVYATANLNGNETTWVKEGATSIGSVPVDMIVSRTTDNLVVVGTHGNGVYSHYYTGDIEEEPAVTEVVAINNIYPNPITNEQGKNSATIEYSIKNSGRVSIKVYDLIGQEVAHLLEADRVAGQHQITWNARRGAGSQVANGIYLLNIQANGEQATEQVLVLRE